MSLSEQRTSFHTSEHTRLRDSSYAVFYGTQNMLENSKAKLAKKNADMIVANNLKVAGAGFGTDTNVVTLITADDCTELEIMDKSCVAARIMDRLLKM